MPSTPERPAAAQPSAPVSAVSASPAPRVETRWPFESRRPTQAPASTPPTAQLAVNTHQKLSAADRSAIDTLLDRFFPAAVERRDARTAWALAGPEMRSASSLSDWITTDIAAGNDDAFTRMNAGRRRHYGW